MHKSWNDFKTELKKRRWIIVGSAAALMLTLLEIPSVGVWRAPDLIALIVNCLLIVATPIVPRIGAVCIILQYVFDGVIPYDFATSELSGSWFALILAGYYLPGIISFLLFLCAPGMMTADIFLHPFDEVSPEGAIGFFSISLGLYLAGLMLRRHGIKQKIAEKKQQMARIENENSRLHRDNMLAIRLHDSIAGGVSSIALASSLHDPDDEVLREIHHDAVTVLERIHEILALLADREGRWRENSVPKVPLQEVIQNIDMSLNSLGFRGKTEITLNEVVFDSELGALLEDFLMEIRQNIERHSSMKGGDYAMSVRVEGDEVLIRQTNPISDETASLVPSELSTHKGLMLYKQRIESMGGSLEYEVSDSTWFLFASLPLHKI